MTKVPEKKPKMTRVIKTLKEFLDKYDKFLAFGTPPDILILKSHLLCEYYMNQIIILTEKSNARELRDLDFFAKCNKAFDLNKSEDKTIHSQIIALNRLRNKLGHELDFALSESDIDELGFTIGKDYILMKYEIETREKLFKSVLNNIMARLCTYFLLSIKKHEPREATGEVSN